MNYYYNILSRQIERSTRTKEELQRNIALWQIYGLISEEDFMALMTLTATKFPEQETPSAENPADPPAAPELTAEM